MADDLIMGVQQGLRAKKGEWRRIAREVPDVSYSWIEKMASGNYGSSPAYRRLQAVAAWLERERQHELERTK
jgi:hypothetical protein